MDRPAGAGGVAGPGEEGWKEGTITRRPGDGVGAWGAVGWACKMNRPGSQL